MKSFLFLMVLLLVFLSAAAEARQEGRSGCRAVAYSVSFHSGLSSGVLSSETLDNLQYQLGLICQRAGCDSIGEISTKVIPGYYDSKGICHPHPGKQIFL